MFVDTPETQATRSFMAEEVRRAANRLLSGIRTHKDYPTYISRKELRDDYMTLLSVWGIYGRVGGYDVRNAELESLVSSARQAARDYGIKR